MSLQPLLDKVIVEPIEAEEKTKAGLIVAGGNQQNLEKGVVVASGPGYYESGLLIQNGVSKGQTVLYPRFAGTEYKDGGRKLLFISSRDLVAVDE